jgi:hypothetical protein
VMQPFRGRHCLYPEGVTSQSRGSRTRAPPADAPAHPRRARRRFPANCGTRRLLRLDSATPRTYQTPLSFCTPGNGLAADGPIAGQATVRQASPCGGGDCCATTRSTDVRGPSARTPSAPTGTPGGSARARIDDGFSAGEQPAWSIEGDIRPVCTGHDGRGFGDRVPVLRGWRDCSVMGWSRRATGDVQRHRLAERFRHHAARARREVTLARPLCTLLPMRPVSARPIGQERCERSPPSGRSPC